MISVSHGLMHNESVQQEKEYGVLNQAAQDSAEAT
jgi:hypothetical protein